MSPGASVSLLVFQDVCEQLPVAVRFEVLFESAHGVNEHWEMIDIWEEGRPQHVGVV